MENNFTNILETNFERLDLNEQQEFHKLFKKNIDGINPELYKKLKKIIFRLEPPTPKQFLDHKEGWVSKLFEESLYDYVKEDFYNILDPSKTHSEIVYYGGTRTSKSTIARLLVFYTIVYAHCLRYPSLYYELSASSKLAIYLMSFKAEKVEQLLLSPIYEYFRLSPRFERVHFKNKVSEAQYKHGLNKIYWSEASDFGKLTVDSGITLNLGTNFMDFIGSDMIQLYVSEINFFMEKANITQEQIFQIYTQGSDRIKSTVGKQYLCHVFLDSSANNVENIIEQYILEQVPNQENTFYRRRARWDCEQHINKYKIWKKTGQTFPIFTGTNVIPPKILQNEREIEEYPKNKIVDVPIDLLEDFSKPGALTTSLKDIAGIPVINEDKFIQNPKLIENIWSKYLENIEGGLIVDSAEFPECYIWDRVHSKFFIQHTEDTYILKRASSEPRYLHIDTAHSSKGDLVGITLLHKEWCKEYECIYFVSDFTFGILPGTNGINLAAIEKFVYDLVYIGNVNLYLVSTDSFQSKLMEQNLQRDNIEAKILSVDRTTIPYNVLLTNLHNQVIKVGKNVFLKNNLESLIVTKTASNKEKIDHTSGKTENKYKGDFKTSKCGINAKDISDSLCGAFYSAYTDETTTPSIIWENENKKMSSNFEDKQELIQEAYKKLKVF